MQFSATVKPRSVPWRNWKSIGRLGGHIEGVKFTWTGYAFVADNLTPHQVELLRPLPSVELHCTAVPLDAAAIARQYGERPSEPASSSPAELPAATGEGASPLSQQVPVMAPAQARPPAQPVPVPPLRVPPPPPQPPLRGSAPPASPQPPLRLPQNYGKFRGKPGKR